MTMNMNGLQNEQQALGTAGRLVALARAAGADVAEAGFFYGCNSSLAYREGEVSDLEQSETLDMNLRVWVGHRLAFLSGNQLDNQGLKNLAEQAVARARHLPETPDVTLPTTPDRVQRSIDMDWHAPDLESLRSQSQALYDGIMAVDGIINSDGGHVGWSKSRSAVVASNGLEISQVQSRFYRSVGAQAGSGDQRVRDYDETYKTHVEDLKSIEGLIRRASARALARVGAQPVLGFEGPVIFEPRVAKSLFAGFLSAISGAAIAKGQSFLKDAMGQGVFSSQVQIHDDPTLARGLASRLIDAEGHAPQKLDLIKDGVLQTWLLDRRSAAKLGLVTNARAAHGGGGVIVPGSTNVQVFGGNQSPDELVKGVERGLFVTEMMGQGLNALTGDYSRGAAGFLIEQGRISRPVQAMTIAGSMQTIFKTLILANDMDMQGSLHAPSVKVPHMSIAGLS